MSSIFRVDCLPGLRGFEQRIEDRAAIALPIRIGVGGTRHSALLRNLSSAGAMIDTSGPLAVRGKIEFHCGTICTCGTVLWQRGSTFGIEFSRPIGGLQISEQISRSAAVAGRRDGRELSVSKGPSIPV